MSERTRDEHVAWCKERAHEYLKTGDILNAIMSMSSDMGKHPECARAGEAMAPVGLLYIINHDMAGARSFIDGFR